MKLKIYAFTLPFLISAAFESLAQTAPKTFPQTFDKAQPEIMPVQAEKIAGTGSRPLATANYKSNGSTIRPTDSAAYAYPSNTTLLNDTTYKFTYSSGAWVPTYKEVFSYDAAGHVTGYDVLQWYSWSGTWNPYQKATYTLNGDGFPVTILVQSWNSSTSTYQNAFRYTYVRDAQNYPTQYTTEQWDFTYNRWNGVSRFTYAYNSKHAYTQYIQEAFLPLYGVWLNQVRLDYSYDATDTVLIKQSQYGWASNVQSWAAVYQSYYYNNPTTNKPDSVLMNSYNTSGVEQPSRRIIFGYDGAGQRTSETVEVWTTSKNYMNLYQIQNEYNSYGQQTVLDVKYWQNNAWSYANANAYRNNYYYEEYTTTPPPTKVATLSNEAIAALNLSPVPAVNVLNVKLEWSVPQDFSIVITDLNGRVVSRMAQTAGQEFATPVSIANLPAGNYLLSVKGAKGGSAAKMFTVSR